MKIFNREVKDGLTDVINSNKSIAFTTIPKSFKNIKTDPKLEKTIASNNFGANPNQKDLFYLESILASVGMNKNRDIFLKAELWNARSTPEDKPFNYMHDENDIIGHLTSGYAVTKEGVLIPDDTELDTVPDEFDIVVGAVLYKYWKDEEKRERMEQIIASISSDSDLTKDFLEDEDEWFVSMECMFPHFDYGLINAEGELKIVERNEETSFLTKHLAIYGGSGVYENYTLGRVLRNFFFSGKGLVTDPANPESAILSSALAYKTKENSETMENKMTVDTVSMKQFEDLQNKLEAAEASAKQAVEKEVTSLKEQLENAKAEKADLAKDIEDAQAKIKEAEEAKAEVEKAQEETKAELEKVQAQVAEMEAKVAKANRISQLNEVGVSGEAAEKLVESFASASDEMFAEVVKMQEAVAKKGEAMCDKEDKKKEDKAKAEAEAEQNTEQLEEAEANEDANLGTEEDGSQELQASVASFFKGFSKNIKK